MKTHYILLPTLIFTASFTFAQNLGQKLNLQKATREATMESVSQQNASKTKTQLNKAPGDTLYYEDFSSGGPGGGQLPTGWTRNNNAGNINDWIWSTAAPGGQYTTIGPLADTVEASGDSTSASNGFMSMRGDFYNTPTPTGGFVNITYASFQSPAITIANPPSSVILQFTHALNWNGPASGEIVVEVSTDGVSWTTHNAKNGSLINFPSDNAEIVTINVSATLANANTAYVRFRQSGISHYYWMIDDVLLLEGIANSSMLEDYTVNFTDTFASNPQYTIVPKCVITSPYSFTGATFNSGANAQTNVYLRADVSQDSTFGGSVGIGSVWRDSVLVGAVVPSGQRDTNTVPGFNAASVAPAGKYTATIDVVSDSINQAPNTSVDTYEFEISDTVLAKDRGVFTGGIGGGSFVGGGNQGDRMAALFSVGGNGDTITSLSIYVSNNTLNNGVEIVPKVWSIGSTGPIGTFNVVAENTIPTTITPAMYGTWITLDFSIGTGPVELKAGNEYAMGWEQVNGGGAEFYAGRDLAIQPFVPDATNYIYIAGSTNAWYWVSSTPGVRANFGSVSCLAAVLIGEDEAKLEARSQFSVAPNPSNGNFTLEVNSNTAIDYNLSIKNSLGQSVYNDVINVNGQYREDLNFENLEKGLYFVTLRNGDERLVKKVVLK